MPESKSTIKFVVVSKGPLTIDEAESLRPQAIQEAKKGSSIPVLVTHGDPIRNPLTVEDLEKIRELIDTEIAWVRIGDRIAHLIISEV